MLSECNYTRLCLNDKKGAVAARKATAPVEFSKAGDILKKLDMLVLQAESLKSDIQQEEITKEDVDKLRDIEPK